MNVVEEKRRAIRERYFNRGSGGTVARIFKGSIDALIFMGCLAGLIVSIAVFVIFLYLFAPFFW